MYIYICIYTYMCSYLLSCARVFFVGLTLLASLSPHSHSTLHTLHTTHTPHYSHSSHTLHTTHTPHSPASLLTHLTTHTPHFLFYPSLSPVFSPDKSKSNCFHALANFLFFQFGFIFQLSFPFFILVCPFSVSL